MFEEFEMLENVEEVEHPREFDTEKDLDLSGDRFHVVETDDPENPVVVGGVPELWAERLDTLTGDNQYGMIGCNGLLSVCNIERMAGMTDVTETDVCTEALLTGNCLFDINDIENSGKAYMEMQEDLLDRQGIESTTYYSPDADVEQIAEWVEDGHGVIMNYCDHLADDFNPDVSVAMFLDWETVSATMPRGDEIAEYASTLQDGESIEMTLPDTGVGMELSGIVTNEGFIANVDFDIWQSSATVDEYGTPYMDNAVAVTGTVRDVDGNLLGLRVCNGSRGDGDRFISVENLENCYTNAIDSGVVVTDNPIHVNGNPINA
ncbi:MAG: hypothetical protein LUG86_08935 [Oscillospiraceae bacterium]|nr:hypothetical protein [Oscillospiraceae bacterium]